MTSVLKVQNLDYRATPGDVRRVFKDNGARPANIHLGLFENGKPNGTAFIIFTDRRDADNGLRLNGTICRDSRISVRASNPKEFDRMFPGKPMLEKEKVVPNKNDRLPDILGVVRVDNIDFQATLSDIRKFFREHGARPADIHILRKPNEGKHDTAFLIFNIPSEKSNALKLDGALFRDNRLSVKSSSPKEFDRHFPRVPMITKKPNTIPGGRGRGRGVDINNGGGGISRPALNDRNQDGFSGSIRGRGQGLRGGRGEGGGLSNRVGGRFSDSQFFGSRQDNMNNGRGRSRSPISRGRRDSNLGGEQPLPMDRGRFDPVASKQPGIANTPRFEEPLGAINERKFLRISGLPYNASQVDIQEYFRPILTRDIYIMRNISGKFAGKFNGSAIVEFFSDGDARQATKMDGSKFGHQSITVVRASKDEIMRTIQENKFSSETGGPASQPVPDITAINTIAQNNPQVQHLLNLLTATVNTIAGAAAAAVTQPKPDRRESRNGRGDRNDRNRDDPVISRVASSANIDVSDIKLGRVVGLRNLPFSVTPEEILQFFRNYKVIPDSVRIHYLDDGRCSGDAIICFRGNRDARNAVTDLNKTSIGRRKVELFFL